MKWVMVLLVFVLAIPIFAGEAYPVELKYKFSERQTDTWSDSEIKDKEKLLAKYEKALPKYEAAAQKKPGDYFAEKLIRKTRMQILFLRDDLRRVKVGKPIKGGVEVALPKTEDFGWTELNILVNGKPVVEKLPRATFSVVMRYVAPEGANEQGSTPTLESTPDRETRVSNLSFENAQAYEVVNVGGLPEWILVMDDHGGLWSVFISYTAREKGDPFNNSSGGGGSGGGGSGGGGSGGSGGSGR